MAALSGAASEYLPEKQVLILVYLHTDDTFRCISYFIIIKRMRIRRNLSVHRFAYFSCIFIFSPICWIDLTQSVLLRQYLKLFTFVILLTYTRRLRKKWPQMSPGSREVTAVIPVHKFPSNTVAENAYRGLLCSSLWGAIWKHQVPPSPEISRVCATAFSARIQHRIRKSSKQ